MFTGNVGNKRKATRFCLIGPGKSFVGISHKHFEREFASQYHRKYLLFKSPLRPTQLVLDPEVCRTILQKTFKRRSLSQKLRFKETGWDQLEI